MGDDNRQHGAYQDGPRGDADAGPRVLVSAGVWVARSALEFAYTSSGGPGGQNVNRRATRAQLRVRLDDLPITPGARQRLSRLAGSQLTVSGDILIASDTHRTQAQNRRACLDRLGALVGEATRPPKRRIPTKPTRGAERRRLDEKKRRGDIKRRRRGPGAGGGEW